VQKPLPAKRPLWDSVALAPTTDSMATLGIKGYKALRRDRREQLTAVRRPDGDPIPQKARARIERLLDRLDLVLAGASTSRRENDPPDDAAPLQTLKRFACVAERSSLNWDIRHSSGARETEQLLGLGEVSGVAARDRRGCCVIRNDRPTEGDRVHLSDERMIVILLVGVAAGYLAGRFARGSGSGLVGDAAVGIVAPAG
jgi:hypothetical protein